MITHIVIFWTDKPHGAHRERLLAGTRKLAQIPGVVEFRAGIPVPSPRGVVDESYAVGISMSFESQAVADLYQSHPLHLEFVEQCVKPLVKRLVVYDWS